MSSGKAILGLLAGLAAGAALGILFAPDRGSSTRKKISKKRDEYVDSLGEKVNEFIDSVNKKFETVKQEGARLAERGRAKVEDMEEDLVALSNSKMNPKH